MLFFSTNWRQGLSLCVECHQLSLLIECAAHLSVWPSGLVYFFSQRLMHNIQTQFTLSLTPSEVSLCIVVVSEETGTGKIGRD